MTGQAGVRLTVRFLGTTFEDQVFNFMMVAPNQLKPADSGTDELGTVVDNGRRINWMRGNWTGSCSGLAGTVSAGPDASRGIGTVRSQQYPGSQSVLSRRFFA